MKEKIIFAPGCNEAEFLRTLSKFGKNTIGTRVVNAVELSRIALLKAGKPLTQTYITRSQEAPLIDSFIRNIAYFNNAAFLDSQNMANTFFSLRSLIVEDEANVIRTQLPLGEFTEKNEAIVEVYDAYCNKLEDLKIIDTIGLIQKAIEVANPIDADFFVLSEYPLSPLEMKLLEVVSAGQYNSADIPNFCGQSQAANANEPHVTEAFGISNEVENILSYIFKNNIPLDQCTIAVTEAGRYCQLIYDLSQEYDFEVTFGIGLPIQNSNPTRLLKEYSLWNGPANQSVAALNSLIFNNAFDRNRLKAKIGIGEGDNRLLHEIVDCAGNLRLSTDQASNNEKLEKFNQAFKDDNKDQILAVLTNFARILEWHCADFVSAFSKICEGYFHKIDKSAKNAIAEFFDNYFKFCDAADCNSAIEEIMKLRVLREESKEGALFVTNIDGALASLRKHLFIAGLSYDFFPGSPKENYIMLDSDYLLLPNNDAAPTSNKLVENKIAGYKNLLNAAQSMGAEVRLSYSDFDSAELKEKNASSVLPREANEIVGYFDCELSTMRLIGQKVKSGEQIKSGNSEPAAEVAGDNGNASDSPATKCSNADFYLDKRYAPTQIETYFACPRKFFYKIILGIKEPEDEKPYEVISAADLGTLFHEAMKNIANKEISKDKLIEDAEEQFDNYLELHVPLSDNSANKAKQNYIELIKNIYDMPGMKNEVIDAETDFKATHDATGIKLHGYPDRIESTDKGNIIADFKTGKRIIHEQDNVDSCIQALLYAYIAEKNGKGPITSCEFRYPRVKLIIKCAYNDDVKRALDEKLEAFKKGLEEGVFPCTEKSIDEEPCKYCKLKNLCGKGQVKK